MRSVPMYFDTIFMEYIKTEKKKKSVTFFIFHKKFQELFIIKYQKIKELKNSSFSHRRRRRIGKRMAES